jgi:hypothetical protein
MGGQESQNQNGAARKALGRHPQRNMERHVALACPILAIKNKSQQKEGDPFKNLRGKLKMLKRVFGYSV